MKRILVLVFLLQFSCQANTGRFNTTKYNDGVYCAQVRYYYSETDTRSTYTLLVQVEDNHLIKINWPNGGWLDDSHFRPPTIEDGCAKFLSDRGVEYKVTILGAEGDCILSNSAADEDYLMKLKEKQDIKNDNKQDEEQETQENQQE